MPSRAMPVDGPIRDVIETGRTRLLITGAVILLAFGCIGVRLVDLTVLRPAQEPRTARTAQFQGIETERADIVDRNGAILASGLATASLYANPRRVIDPKDAARLVASVLPQVDPVELAAKLSQDRGFIWLARNLTPREQWEIHRLGIPGLDFQREETRIYPHGPLVSHILGYTDIDNHGIAGLERSYDSRLRGDRGAMALTLDIRVQHIMRDALSEAMERHSAIGGAGVVLDIKSGEVLSLVSLPDFDPHQPGAASDAQRRNRATLDVYELGSAFKIFTTAMALDSGVVTLRGGYDATKPIRISRHTIRDYHAKRRWLSVPEIFMYSSNIGAAKMAMDVGIERQRKYLKNLGMLTSAPVELPEVGAPLLPERWSPVHSMTVAFGHGIAVSPLQMASGVAAVLNDGVYMPPTLIKRDESTDAPTGHRVISKQTSRQMRRLLRLVVEQGTGRRAAANGYVVGGKTGTAEKQAAGRYRRKSLISSFVGAFPINDPKYLVFAVLDEPKGTKETHGFATGGWVAAPVVRRVVERIGPVVGIAPINEESPELQADLAIDLKRKGHTLASY